MPASDFRDQQYMIRKKVLKLFGQAFHVYDSSGQVVLYSKLKAFKLKEDIRVYAGEDLSEEVLTIKARQLIDAWAAYDVVDSGTGEKVGALRRKAFKSMVRDEWTLLDSDDQEIGLVQEDNVALALVRRFVTNLVPQCFTLTLSGREAAQFKRYFNPFILKIAVDFSPDTEGRLDRRLGMAAGILLSAIEGRQG